MTSATRLVARVTTGRTPLAEMRAMESFFMVREARGPGVSSKRNHKTAEQ